MNTELSGMKEMIDASQEGSDALSILLVSQVRDIKLEESKRIPFSVIKERDTPLASATRFIT